MMAMEKEKLNLRTVAIRDINLKAQNQHQEAIDAQKVQKVEIGLKNEIDNKTKRGGKLLPLFVYCKTSSLAFSKLLVVNSESDSSGFSVK